MAARVPDNRLLVLEGGHACFVEEAEAFNRAVEEFAAAAHGHENSSSEARL